MALVKCRECGREISSQADKCPHCGAPAKKKTSGCALLVAILAGVVIVGSVAPKCSTATAPPASRVIAGEDPAAKTARYNAAKEKFEASIGGKYKELMVQWGSGNIGAAMPIVRQFETFKRMDYKAVRLIAMEVKTSDARSRLARTPPTDLQSLAAINGELHQLHPENPDYTAQAAKYGEEWKARQAELAEQERKATADRAAQAAEAARQAARQRRIEAQFSPWDGSHRALEEIIKKSMNDPDSYKHVETRYGDYGDYILVVTTFRGKNVFGGVVTNTWRAKFTIDGRLIEIVSQGP
jgi:rubrerythrin